MRYFAKSKGSAAKGEVDLSPNPFPEGEGGKWMRGNDLDLFRDDGISPLSPRERG
jgi:hypothetical protein